VNWLLSLLIKPSPGWFRALTKSGKPAGLGFECEVCRELWPHSLQPGQNVAHCGRVEPVPIKVNGLPTRSLGGRSLPGNVIPVFGTLEGPEERPEPQPPVSVQWS
jgi:hypothetical protein